MLLQCYMLNCSIRLVQTYQKLTEKVLKLSPWVHFFLLSSRCIGPPSVWSVFIQAQ
jgi:hypothetical protein